MIVVDVGPIWSSSPADSGLLSGGFVIIYKVRTVVLRLRAGQRECWTCDSSTRRSALVVMKR